LKLEYQIEVGRVYLYGWERKAGSRSDEDDKARFEERRDAERFAEDQERLGRKAKVRVKKNYPYGRKSKSRKRYWECFVYREVKT